MRMHFIWTKKMAKMATKKPHTNTNLCSHKSTNRQDRSGPVKNWQMGFYYFKLFSPD